MVNSVRREQIKTYIEKKGTISLKELASQFSDVSLMTIHRDLDFLENQGIITRMRGGARYIPKNPAESEPAFNVREVANQGEKEIIAKKALPFISTGSAIFLDAGTTTMTLAKIMPDIPFSVVTSGPNIALELSQKQYTTVSVCGGTLNKSNLTLYGRLAQQMIEQVNIDVAFLVASGFSMEGGFTCGNEAEAAIKRLVIDKARKVILLMDSTKVDRMLPFTFAQMKDIDCFICDTTLSAQTLQQAEEFGVTIL